MAKPEESLESNETPPEKPVGDKELDSAIEKTEVEVKVEQKEVKKPETEKEEEHRERSNLGRKVKQLEDVIQQQNERMETLMAKLEKPASSVQEEEVPEDVVRWIETYDKKKEKDKEKFAKAYLTSFFIEGRKDREGNPELYDEVYNEMAVNFNLRYTNDPSIDAALNYAKSKAAVLSKRTAPGKPKPNVKGEKPLGSTSIDVKSSAETELSADVELDDEAREFVKKIGMSQKSIKEALKGEAPAHLRK